MIRTYYLSDGVSMVTETSGTRTGTLDSEYKNIGIIPIYFVLHWLLGLFALSAQIWRDSSHTITDNLASQ